MYIGLHVTIVYTICVDDPCSHPDVSDTAMGGASGGQGVPPTCPPPVVKMTVLCALLPLPVLPLKRDYIRMLESLNASYRFIKHYSVLSRICCIYLQLHYAILL